MFDLLLKGGRVYDGSGMPRLTDDGCGGAARTRRASQGGGEVVIENGAVRGAYPGRVLRNTPPPLD
jgi:hypothetical protein